MHCSERYTVSKIQKSSISDEFRKWHIVTFGQNLLMMKDKLGKDTRPKFSVYISHNSFIGKAHVSHITIILGL